MFSAWSHGVSVYIYVKNAETAAQMFVWRKEKELYNKFRIHY